MNGNGTTQDDPFAFQYYEQLIETSGKRCIRAIDMKMPPAKELAIPKIDFEFHKFPTLKGIHAAINDITNISIKNPTL